MVQAHAICVLVCSVALCATLVVPVPAVEAGEAAGASTTPAGAPGYIVGASVPGGEGNGLALNLLETCFKIRNCHGLGFDNPVGPIGPIDIQKMLREIP